MTPEPDVQPFVQTLLWVMGLGCCLVGTGGFIGVLRWMLKKDPAAQPPIATQPNLAGEFHLSVIALAFDATARAAVQSAVSAPGPLNDPLGARVELVRQAAAAFLGIEAAWRAFGYGDKPLFDLPNAQQSYAAALTDFRTRSGLSDDGGPLAVATLILCTRGRRLGLEQLDARAQIHALLQDRLQLETSNLLGAELVWAPIQGGLTEAAVRQRYPEMHALVA